VIANFPTITIRLGAFEISICRAQSRVAEVVVGPGSLGEIWPAQLVERVEADLRRPEKVWECTSRWR
jgi:hypothetical protein